MRLVFGEEPDKQMMAISKFLIVPILFILFTIFLWFKIAPHHKTKSGEVPTPDVVWNSAKINHEFDFREKTKSSDLLLTGKDREETLAIVQAKVTELEATNKAALAEVKEVEKKYNDEVLPQRIKDADKELKDYTAEVKVLKKRRTKELSILADDVVNGDAERKALVARIEADDAAADLEKEKIKELKSIVSNIRSEKYKPLEEARSKSNSIADELQFLKKRIEFLTKSNRDNKVKKEAGMLADLEETLAASTTQKDLLSNAKKIVKSKESIDRLANQKYAAAVTVYQQIKRSLFTVLCGFLMAALIAIPVGIMCGLNKVIMACLTPIISIFKPVSPVVWLLIFQIVVGAFFPDPETHPFFVFLNGLWLIDTLKINPALIFSACTVAICAVWPALVNTALGVSSVDRDHINVARVLRLGFKDRLFKIIIPSSLPYVFAGLRISLGVGWMVLIAAEALSSSDGLGKFVWDEYQNGSSYSFANIIYACFVIGIIGFFLDRMMILLQRLVSFDDGKSTL